MPKSHSKGGEKGHVGHGSPGRLHSVTYQRIPLPYERGKVAMGRRQGNNVLVCHHGKTRNKAAEADSSWKATSEGNGQETGSAALREGTVRRGKERPPFFLK